MPGASAGSASSTPTIAVRFEGGVGDHILGMRLIRFIRARYPQHRLIAYSDAAGAIAQMDVLRLSKQIDEIRAVRQKPGVPMERLGQPENIIDDDLRLMRSADSLLDAWGGCLFIPAASLLGEPVFDILASRPELTIPAEAEQAADHMLAAYRGRRLVGMNVGKYAGLWPKMAPRLKQLLAGILTDERVVVLHLYQTKVEFGHWPADMAQKRQLATAMERAFAEELNHWHPRIVPMTDLPLATVAALIKRCCYFVGVDNGIKHLAWALGVPHTLYFPPYSPGPEQVLRWIPDVHRMITSACTDEGLASHVADARRAIANAS